MLRTTSNSLFAKTSTAWKNPALYSSLKSYTTANNATTPATAATNTTEKKKDLSARLGGSGRGKVITEGGASSSDPFASFLANAKKPRTQNNNRNGSFTPRPRKQQGGDNKGQFADASAAATTTTTTTEKTENNNKKIRQPRTQRTEGANNNNRSRSSQQQGQQGQQGQKVETQGKRQARTNNRNRNNDKEGSDQKQPRRRASLTRTQQQPQEVRTRRATTFIDKDIDWSSFTLEETSSTTATATTTNEQQPEDAELLLKDIQGDYNRYLDIGSDMKWSQMINGTNVGTLVGSNPTFDLSQKTSFLAALSFATGGSTATATATARK